MTLKNAIEHFEQLIDNTNKKSTIRLYMDFLQLLDALDRRCLSPAKLRLVEDRLASLDLEERFELNRKHFRYVLSEFKRFLNVELSIVPKGYYTSLGVVYGGAVGLILGMFNLSGMDPALDLVMSISIFTVIGELVAVYLEHAARTSGKLI